MKQHNKFEMLAHDVQFQHPFVKHQRPSWEHTITTYTGNNQKIGWFLVAATVFLVGFGLLALIVIYATN